MADHNIYIGETVRVELADSYIDVKQLIRLFTIETNEGTYFSVNPAKITAINWAVKIAEGDYRIRLFLDDKAVDIDPLKEINRAFFSRVFSEEWKKYLIPQHRQQLENLRGLTE